MDIDKEDNSSPIPLSLDPPPTPTHLSPSWRVPICLDVFVLIRRKFHSRWMKHCYPWVGDWMDLQVGWGIMLLITIRLEHMRIANRCCGRRQVSPLLGHWTIPSPRVGNTNLYLHFSNCQFNLFCIKARTRGLTGRCMRLEVGQGRRRGRGRRARRGGSRMTPSPS